MTDTWLIGDTHFGYERVLTFVDDAGRKVRPFRDTDEMDETLIENWNRVVKPGDTVLHLGDVTNAPGERFETIWRRLNGTKHLIVGNHDDIVYLVRGGFFADVRQELKLRDLRLHLSHQPLHPTMHEIGAPGTGNFFCNVHGHIHQNPTPAGRYVNVSVEAIGYTPVHLDVVAEQARKLLDDTESS